MALDLSALASLDEDALKSWTPEDVAYVLWQTKWAMTARPNQLPPETAWNEAGFMAGRGFGKTRVGAEWLGAASYEDPDAHPSAVIAPTYGDVKFTCFEGPAGLLNVMPKELIVRYNSSDMIIEMKTRSGKTTTIRGFTAEKPERLRGPQHARIWCFHPSTAVTMGDLSVKTITEVCVGDMVMTRVGPKRVVAAGPSGNENPYVRVHVTADNGDEVRVICTDDHPIRANGEWVAAGKLREGDRLIFIETQGDVCDQGREEARFIGATVDYLKDEPTHEPNYFIDENWNVVPAGYGDRIVPHCITVEDEAEFFANGILVHNCDELSSWQYDEETWDMAMMGLRLGASPQILWTTTPKPKELVRKLIEPKDGRFVVRGSTFENKANLPDSFFAQLEQYEGTTLGRQELYGELIDPEESGIIKRSWFRLWPAKKPLPQFDWIIMSLDTAFTEATFDRKNGADSSACVVLGVFQHDGVSNLIVLDCWAEQLGLPDLMKRVKRELQNRYGDDEDTAVIRPMFGSSKPMTSGRAPDILLIEDKGSGISLRQMLARDGIEAYAYNPGRADKLSRLHIASPVFAQKRVWLPESDKFKGRAKTWIDPMLAQLCAFTGAGSIKHDDYVDAMTQAVRLCMDKGLVTTVKASEEKRRAVEDSDRARAPREYQNPYAA